MRDAHGTAERAPTLKFNLEQLCALLTLIRKRFSLELVRRVHADAEGDLLISCSTPIRSDGLQEGSRLLLKSCGSPELLHL
ncbi:hypothetical protein R1flu_019103 [Riccia fluitans]|uniref:Uncharacterized protein n=1 Tax=Riccia fluitans TaxID=41844 RepID=A0ABD1ZJ80_9MARC